MSIEKTISYDNPSAPIVRFASMDYFDADEDEDMNDNNSISTTESTLGLKEDFLQFDRTNFSFFALDRTFIFSIFIRRSRSFV